MLIIGGIILWLLVVIVIMVLFASAKGEDVLRLKSHVKIRKPGLPLKWP